MSQPREQRPWWLPAGVFCLFACLLLAACGPHLQAPSARSDILPHLGEEIFRASDGTELPLRRWPAAGTARAAVIALHGFNDYRAAFDLAAPLLAKRGIEVLAFDQRGFGADPQAGVWAGSETMVDDVLTLARLMRAEHPDLPLYLLGESMGASVSVVAAARPVAETLFQGVILVAPAPWGWSEMNVFYRMTLWLGAHALPGWRLTGRGLGRVASDNREALIAMGRDPLIIKATRIDAIYGLVELMQQALDRAPEMHPPALVLYGEKDEIVPRHAVEALIEQLPDDRTSVRHYPEGWHLLLRDLGRDRVVEDIAGFVTAPAGRVGLHGTPR